MQTSVMSRSSRLSLERYVVAVGIAAFMPLAVYVHKGLAVLLVVVALCVMAMRYRDFRWRDPIFAIFVAFAALGVLSTMWSPNPSESLSTIASVAVTIVLGWALVGRAYDADADDICMWETALIIGGVLGYGAMLIELISSGAPSAELQLWLGRRLPGNPFLGLKPGLAVGAIYFWPWALTLLRRISKYAAVVLIVITICTLSLLESGTTATAVAIGFLFGMCAIFAGQRAIALLALTLAGLVLAAPLFFKSLGDPSQPGSNLSLLPNSALHRVYIWRGAVDLIADRPVLGHGFDSSRMMSRGKEVERVVFLPDVPERSFFIISERIPLHPHSLMLQVWLEVGAAGACLLALLFYTITKRAADAAPTKRERFISFGMIGSALTICTVGFGAWQSWWLATLFLLAMMAVSLARPGHPGHV